MMSLPAHSIIRYLGWLIFGCMIPTFSCRHHAAPESAEFRVARELSLEWNRLLVELERNTPGYRVPITARTFAYVSCAAWQAALPGLNEGISIQKYCPGYIQPSRPPFPFYLPASLNAAYAESMRQFFPTAPPHLQEKIQWLESGQAEAFRQEVDPDICRTSANYGKRTAIAVWSWSATDSIGHDAFLNNFDRHYTPPQCPGCWQPGGSQPIPALLPHWGNIRAFLVTPGSVEVQAPVNFDEHPASACYAEAMEVYSISKPLSKENHWIAELWSDDVPGFTVTPTGRWVCIANQVLEQTPLPLPQMLQLYLKMGLALSDALVICWDAKYRFNRERPESYIRRNIRADWNPLHESPSFPAYPSGHAALGAASAVLLTDFFGETFEFTDRTHEDRREFAGQARQYRSFDEMAHENAFSRVALGVHFRMDCEEGLRLGRIVGERVANLAFFRDDISMAR